MSVNVNLDGASAGNMPSHQALVKQIGEASFAVDDISLYLDTHPTDRNALAYYHYAAALRREAVAAHAAYFGPLMTDQVTSGTYWTWMTEQWPWEGGMQ